MYEKLTKFPNLTWLLPEKLPKYPNFYDICLNSGILVYMISARKIPKFYIIIARKIFFPNFWGHVPSLHSPNSYEQRRRDGSFLHEHWGLNSEHTAKKKKTYELLNRTPNAVGLSASQNVSAVQAIVNESDHFSFLFPGNTEFTIYVFWQNSIP